MNFYIKISSVNLISSLKKKVLFVFYLLLLATKWTEFNSLQQNEPNLIPYKISA